MRNSPYFFVAAIALLLVIDFYSFQAIKTVTRDMGQTARRAWEIVFWGITACTVLLVIATNFIPVSTWPLQLRTYLFAVFMLIYLAKLFLIVFLALDDVIRLFRWLYTLVSPPKPTPGPNDISRLKFISQVGMALASFTFLAGVYGMVANAYNYRIHRIKIKLPNLPEAFNGLKIVQLSDIHSGSFTRTEPLKHAIETINKENADVIFFTGDLVNNRASEVEPYLDIFGKLRAKQGVYSTFGNHDYGDYDPEFRRSKQAWDANHKDLIAHHKTMGWDLLMDENRILQRGNDKLAIIGIQNCAGGELNFKTYGDLAKAYKGTEDVPVKLLLSHDPSFWDYEIRKAFPDIDITFAGHTHGAQLGIEIPGLRWSPSQYIYKQWAGLYQKGKQYIYVNRGFGFIGYPGRLGILPEITVMELYKG